MAHPTSPTILPDPASLHLVRLELHVRRFFCSNKACVRQIFTERLPNVVAPYARCTVRLGELFTLIGFADREGKQASAWWMEWG